MSYKRSKYFLTPEKRKINYLLANKNSKITVVFFHGFMSDMNGKKPFAVQNFCKKQKLNFLKFEYSGHGKSSGVFTKGNISEGSNDAKKSIKKIVKKNNFILIGSSMGAWISLIQFQYIFLVSNFLRNFHPCSVKFVQLLFPVDREHPSLKL